MAANRSETYTANEVVKFHDVLSNISPNGSGWNADTNKFRCSDDGYYQFIDTLYKGEGGNSVNCNYWAYLMVSNTVIVRMFNYRTTGDIYYSSTMSAIVPCEAGQEVWVRIQPWGHSTVYLLSSTNQYQHFSGQLIKQGLD